MKDINRIFKKIDNHATETLPAREPAVADINYLRLTRENGCLGR